MEEFLDISLGELLHLQSPLPNKLSLSQSCYNVTALAGLSSTILVFNFFISRIISW